MRIAVEGLALARSLFSGTDAEVSRRLDGIRSTLKDLDESESTSINRAGVDVRELDASAGYALWAESYDEAENPLIVFEEPIMQSLVGPGPWGDVLDACTGTGRHLSWLGAHARSATGLDQSPEMIALARRKVRGASFLVGDLCGDHQGELPDASFDLIVCSLALTHFADVAEPIAALARLVRPGGRIVLTDFHPLATFFDGQAFFSHADGDTPFVRNHSHPIASYLRAFRDAGLVVDECVEAALGEGDGPMHGGVMQVVGAEATRAAYLGMPFVLGWALHRPAG
jgi:SAM-dependent methyltransferase